MKLLSLSTWIRKDGQARIIIEVTDENGKRQKFVGETFSISGDRIIISGGTELREKVNESEESNDSNGRSNRK